MPPEFLFLYARLDYACNIFLKKIAAIQQKKNPPIFPPYQGASRSAKLSRTHSRGRLRHFPGNGVKSVRKKAPFLYLKTAAFQPVFAEFVPVVDKFCLVAYPIAVPA